MACVAARHALSRVIRDNAASERDTAALIGGHSATWRSCRDGSEAARARVPREGPARVRPALAPARGLHGARTSAPTCWRRWSSASSRCRCRWRSRSRAGVPPQHGLYTAIIAGHRVLAARRHALPGDRPDRRVRRDPGADRARSSASAGLLVAGMMAGVILVVMGLARLGKLMQFVPHPVTTGFTMGIAIVIGVLQLKDVFGVRRCRRPRARSSISARCGMQRGAINYWDVGIARRDARAPALACRRCSSASRRRWSR